VYRLFAALYTLPVNVKGHEFARVDPSPAYDEVFFSSLMRRRCSPHAICHSAGIDGGRGTVRQPVAVSIPRRPPYVEISGLVHCGQEGRGLFLRFLGSAAVKYIPPSPRPGEAAMLSPRGSLIQGFGHRTGDAGAVELPGFNFKEPPLFVHMPSFDKVNSYLQRGGAVSFAVFGLEHVKLASFNGKLHVLHIL
jgi:hypothetical protein